MGRRYQVRSADAQHAGQAACAPQLAWRPRRQWGQWARTLLERCASWSLRGSHDPTRLHQAGSHAPKGSNFAARVPFSCFQACFKPPSCWLSEVLPQRTCWDSHRGKPGHTSGCKVTAPASPCPAPFCPAPSRAARLLMGWPLLRGPLPWACGSRRRRWVEGPQEWTRPVPLQLWERETQAGGGLGHLS